MLNHAVSRSGMSCDSLLTDTFNELLSLLQTMGEPGIEEAVRGITYRVCCSNFLDHAALNFFREISDPRKLEGFPLQGFYQQHQPENEPTEQQHRRGKPRQKVSHSRNQSE